MNKVRHFLITLCCIVFSACNPLVQPETVEQESAEQSVDQNTVIPVQTQILAPTKVTPEKSITPDKALETLGFAPKVYSPAFQLVSSRTRAACTRLGMELVVWTVNAPKDMEHMVAIGVDGIITDYPNRFMNYARANGITVR